MTDVLPISTWDSQFVYVKSNKDCLEGAPLILGVSIAGSVALQTLRGMHAGKASHNI
jgi:hypothetical protein